MGTAAIAINFASNKTLIHCLKKTQKCTIQRVPLTNNYQMHDSLRCDRSGYKPIVLIITLLSLGVTESRPTLS
jgi:hypothetical protein